MELHARPQREEAPWAARQHPGSHSGSVFFGSILKAVLSTVPLTRIDLSEPACQYRLAQDWPQGYIGAGDNQALAATPRAKAWPGRRWGL